MEMEARSLKKIIATLEASKSTDLATKWRRQVFEELMRTESLKIKYV
jgi:hypothetical protein